MMTQPTAAAVFEEFRRLPTSERTKFYALLGEGSFQGESLTHEQVFGHLAEDEFSSQEAADYLEVSISTFRRYVRDRKISPSSEVGKSHLFSTKTLKAFKRSLREVKRV
jgi:excisionase family DNA binding protein